MAHDEDDGRRVPNDPILPLVFTRADALGRGFTLAQCERRVATGRWRRLRRGVYCLAERWDSADRRGRHLMLTASALVAMGARHWASHTSAAVLHGFPQPFAPSPVWLTTPSGQSTRYLHGLRVMSASLPAHHVTWAHGMPATSQARTVADCLRHLNEVDALAIADSAAHSRAVTVADVAAVLDRCENWPFVARGRDRLQWVDGRHESPAESWSYVVMRRQALPLPEPQARIYDEVGRFVARVDGWWDECAAVGEVDGLVKYAPMPDEDPEAARERLVTEKVREDALRRLGAEVIRWGTKDLRDERAWAGEVRRRMAQGSRDRFTGSVRLCPPVGCAPRSLPTRTVA